MKVRTKNYSQFVGIILIFMTLLLVISTYKYFTPVYARAKLSLGGPIFNNTHLSAQLVARGLKAPSAMGFVGSNDIVVTEKNTGNVIRVVNGVISQQPLIHVNATKKDERGLLGLAISNNTGGRKQVFLYYSEAETRPNQSGVLSPDPLGNRVYRYDLSGDKLVNAKLLLDLPALPGPRHNAGKIAIGPDNNLYVSIGDVDGSFKTIGTETKAQNYEDGPAPDGRAGILRVTQDGQPVGE